MSRRRVPLIAGAYALFALAAMGTNLGVQRIAAALYGGPGSVMAALVLGTGAGLLVKYVLDKRWIFRYDAGGPAGDVKTFFLYALTGVATTAVFWGTELAFWRFVPRENSRYLGGAIGLAAGYTAKYFLDRALVFRKAQGDARNDQDDERDAPKP